MIKKGKTINIEEQIKYHRRMKNQRYCLYNAHTS